MARANAIRITVVNSARIVSDSSARIYLTNSSTDIWIQSPSWFYFFSAVKCPNGCSGHGKCKHGDCVCDKHYDSKVDCSVKLFCPNQCSGNGACIDGDCHCKMGFCGDACDEDLCPVDNTNGQICGGPVKGRCAAAGCECKSGFSGANCGFKEGWPFKCVTLCGDQCETKCSRALKPLETTNQQTNPGGYLSTDSKDYVDGHKGGHKGER